MTQISYLWGTPCNCIYIYIHIHIHIHMYLRHSKTIWASWSNPYIRRSWASEVVSRSRESSGWFILKHGKSSMNSSCSHWNLHKLGDGKKMPSLITGYYQMVDWFTYLKTADFGKLSHTYHIISSRPGDIIIILYNSPISIDGCQIPRSLVYSCFIPMLANLPVIYFPSYPHYIQAPKTSTSSNATRSGYGMVNLGDPLLQLQDAVPLARSSDT